MEAASMALSKRLSLVTLVGVTILPLVRADDIESERRFESSMNCGDAFVSLPAACGDDTLFGVPVAELAAAALTVRDNARRSDNATPRERDEPLTPGGEETPTLGESSEL